MDLRIGEPCYIPVFDESSPEDGYAVNAVVVSEIDKPELHRVTFRADTEQADGLTPMGFCGFWEVDPHQVMILWLQ